MSKWRCMPPQQDKITIHGPKDNAGESLATSVPRHYPVLGLGHYPSPVQRTSPVTHGLAP